MANKERRRLYYANDDNFDPLITVDVNEYLIDEWPGLTQKQRRSVWTLAQDDEKKEENFICVICAELYKRYTNTRHCLFHPSRSALSGQLLSES